MQYALVILDGASGNAVADFEGRTTLEESSTPHLDKLAQTGMVGLVQNVPAHMASGSDVACLSLMGYDPARYQLGRGAIEAAALGIELTPTQIAFRMNLCSVEAGIMKSYSTNNISTEEAASLVRELKSALDNDTFTLHAGTSFRQVLVMEGNPEALALTYETPHDNTDLDIADAFKPKVPAQGATHNDAALPQDASPQAAPAQAAQATQVTQAAQKVADLLVDYMLTANEILAKSPINAQRISEGKMPANQAWVFWPGTKPTALQPFAEVYGKSAALNSAVDLLVGLAHMTGMKVYRFEGVTDGPNNDFAAQGKGAIAMLEEGNEVVIIHVEAPDAAGHDGCSAQKKNAIEQSDRHIIAPLMKYAKTHPLRIAVMPDHPTPLATRKHGREAVPFVMAGSGIAHNKASRMTEVQAQATNTLFDPGYAFMKEAFLR
ncbi:MAG: 2,3-bisphosphoglycerate-independent phosphoglycerate mutase [Eggerthellaceae bacterium]|nr:2,3-bisphosphoglycerate-independent phosphoglycerate mutase [Eggerthellaceae bacterium]